MSCLGWRNVLLKTLPYKGGNGGMDCRRKNYFALKVHPCTNHFSPAKFCHIVQTLSFCIEYRACTLQCRSVYLDQVSEGQRRRVVEHSPQLPQGFTAVSQTVFWPGQTLEATCQFNSMERDDITWAGATHHHEMCNLYMIMWSELPVFLNCYDSFTSVDYHGAGLATAV